MDFAPPSAFCIQKRRPVVLRHQISIPACDLYFGFSSIRSFLRLSQFFVWVRTYPSSPCCINWLAELSVTNCFSKGEAATDRHVPTFFYSQRSSYGVAELNPRWSTVDYPINQRRELCKCSWILNFTTCSAALILMGPLAAYWWCM